MQRQHACLPGKKQLSSDQIVHPASWMADGMRRNPFPMNRHAHHPTDGRKNNPMAYL
jgi:hypothetical protein